MHKLETRLATLDDLDVVAELFDAYRQFYAQAPDRSLAREFVRDRMHKRESVVLLAATEDGTGVGFCQLYPTFCSVEAQAIYVLYDLYVAPQARRWGAGTLLLQAAHRTAVAHGKVRMDLTTAKTNRAAQAAYVAQGWVRDEVFYAYSKLVSPSEA